MPPLGGSFFIVHLIYKHFVPAGLHELLIAQSVNRHSPVCRVRI
jgi:hypothetical protein